MAGEDAVTSLAVIAPTLPDEMEELRRSRDPAAAEGIPPHLTVLFPFVGGDRVDDELLSELEACVAGVEAFDYTLNGPSLLGEGVAVLLPEPAEPFHDLTRLVMERWPELPPYGGEVDPDELVPHLTLAHDVTTAEVASLTSRLAHLLPLEARAENLSLLVHRDTWSLEHRFAFRT